MWNNIVMWINWNLEFPENTDIIYYICNRRDLSWEINLKHIKKIVRKSWLWELLRDLEIKVKDILEADNTLSEIFKKQPKIKSKERYEQESLMKESIEKTMKLLEDNNYDKELLIFLTEMIKHFIHYLKKISEKIYHKKIPWESDGIKKLDSNWNEFRIHRIYIWIYNQLNSNLCFFQNMIDTSNETSNIVEWETQEKKA